MAHKVKCYYCGKEFDRDKEEAVKVGARRYAHKTCSPYDVTDEKTLEQMEKDAFFEVVKRIYGKDYNFMLINSQAEEYMKQFGYTWSGMRGCLHWFYEINHGSLEEGHGGVGIIPYIYDEVKEYYQNLYQTQEKNKQTKIRRAPVQFNIQSPRAWQQPPHLLDSEEGDKNENY